MSYEGFLKSPNFAGIVAHFMMRALDPTSTGRHSLRKRKEQGESTTMMTILLKNKNTMT
jgi:hypothetical protein